jgi:hypothetical protein
MKTSLNFIISNINKNIIDLSTTLKELQKLECLNQPEITEQDYLKIIKKFPKYNTLSIEDLKNRKQLLLVLVKKRGRKNEIVESVQS